jgi:hypothetical protein
MLVDITTLDGYIKRNEKDKQRNLTSLDLAALQTWIKGCLQYLRANTETQQNLGREFAQERDQTKTSRAIQAKRLVDLDNELKSVKTDTEKTLSTINTWIEHWTPVLEQVEHWVPMLREIEGERSHLSGIGGPRHQ